MHHPARTSPVVGAALVAVFTLAPGITTASPATAATVVADAGADDDSATGSTGHDDHAAGDPDMDGTDGIDHSTHESAPEAPPQDDTHGDDHGTDAPADEATENHGDGGHVEDTDPDTGPDTGPVSRPRGLVLGSFGVFNGAVLVYAARLRRRTAGDHRRRRAARAAALDTAPTAPTAPTKDA